MSKSIDKLLKNQIVSLKAKSFGISKRSFLDLSYQISDIEGFYRDLNKKNLPLIAENNALRMFKLAAQNVPAYSHFLKKNGVIYTKIKSYKDFLQVPVTDKKNYLRKYKLDDLCWGGDSRNISFISASSGATGKSFFWPRNNEDEIETAIYHEMIFENLFKISKRKTLVVICYALGIYVGGTYTLNALEKISQRNYNLNIVTPGIQAKDILYTINSLGGSYDQIILIGYPPFIKDILDKGRIEEGINWKKYNIKFLFSSENFSEDFSHHILSYSNNIQKDKTNIASLYAASDTAVIGFGSEFTSKIRALANVNKSFGLDIFKEATIPSLQQYNPLSKFIEVINNEIVLTCNNALPLIRYNIHDRGGILHFEQFNKKIKENGFEDGLIKTAIPLPLVYLFGRSDSTVTLYGVNIYPENIKEIFKNSFIEDSFIEDFLLKNGTDKKFKQFLEVTLYPKSKLKIQNRPYKKDIIKKILIETLKQYNREFAKLYKEIPGQINVIVKFNLNPRVFSQTQVKRKYTI